MRGIIAGLVLSVSLAACSGSDSTQPAQVAGTWSAQLTDLTGTATSNGLVVAVNCNSTANTQLAITQSGTTIGGSYNGGTITCSALGQQASFDIASGSLTNGSIHGNSIAFHIDSPSGDFTGTVSGNTATGSVTLVDTVAAYNVSGSWSATKD